MAIKKCDTCKATGILKIYHTCPTCDGRGVISIFVPGYGKALQRCADCGGTQKYDWTEEVICPSCDGMGWYHF